MKALAVTYESTSDRIRVPEDGQAENWAAVCDRYDGDVHRVRGADELEASEYDALYVCYDEDNEPWYYLVAEDAELQRARHRVFLRKLGR